MSRIFINIGKSPNDFKNVFIMKPGPVNTPFGNFQMIDSTVIDRIDYLNIKAQQVYTLHSNLVTPEGFVNPTQFVLYRGDLESIVHSLKALIDRIISAVIILEKRIREGDYPKLRSYIDSIGSLLHKDNKKNADIILKLLEEDEVKYLENLNNMANATKHQIVHDNHNLIGLNEPVINIYCFIDKKKIHYSMPLGYFLKSSETIIIKLREKFGELGKILLDIEHEEVD